MSARDVERPVAAPVGKDTHGASVGGVYPAAMQLSDKALEQIRGAGLVRPRAPHPGQQWQPRTGTEQHLLREACRLERHRQLLLGEVGGLRQANASLAAWQRSPAVPDQPESQQRPLTQAQLAILVAGAAGESPEETSGRLLVSIHTVKTHRQRAVKRMGARSFTHAVAMAVAAGWITEQQITGGVAP